MSNVPEPNSERPIDSARDQEEADSRRRAECAERISRLLSAMDGAPSGKTEMVPKAVIRSNKIKPSPDSETRLRFLVVDKIGTRGEFASWEEANHFRNDLQNPGGSVVGVPNKPLVPWAAQEQSTNKPTNLAAAPPVAKLATQPAKPTAAQPVKSEATQPAKPETAQSAKAEATQLAKQEATQLAANPAACDSPNPCVIHELKKAEVLCDSRPDSVPLSNALPVNSTVMRIVGKILPAAAKTATLNACPRILVNRYELLVLGNSGAQITNVVGNLTLTCAPSSAQYETVNIHYTSEPTKSLNRA